MNDPHLAIRNRFEDRYKRFGRDSRSLAYTDEASQHRKLTALAATINMGGHTVLDIGCGMGALLDILKERGEYPLSYTGCDIVGDFIAEARLRFPQSTFLHCNGLSLPDSMKAEIVVASGLFCDDVGCNDDLMRNLFASGIRHATTAFVVQMLVHNTVQRYPQIYYYDPGFVLSLCAPHRYFILNRAYLPHDMIAVVWVS